MRVGRAMIWCFTCFGALVALPSVLGESTMVDFEDLSPECTVTFITAVQEGVGARQYAQSTSSLLPRRTGETRTGAPVREEPEGWEPDNDAADALLQSFAGAGDPIDLGGDRGRGVPMGPMEWPVQPISFPVTCSSPLNPHPSVPVPGGSLTSFIIALAAAEQSAKRSKIDLVLQYEDIERLFLKFIDEEKTSFGHQLTGCITRSAVKRLASRVRLGNGKLATEHNVLQLPSAVQVLSLLNYNKTTLGTHLADVITHESAYHTAPVLVSLGMSAHFGIRAMDWEAPSPEGLLVLDDPDGPVNVTAVGIIGSIRGCEHGVQLVEQQLGPESGVLLINMPAFRRNVNKALSVVIPDFGLDRAQTQEIADEITTAHVWGLIEQVAPAAPRFTLSFSTGFKSILGPGSDAKTGETVVAFEWVEGAVIQEPLEWALGLAPVRVKAMMKTERPVHDLFVDIDFAVTMCRGAPGSAAVVHKTARKVEAMLFKKLTRASSISDAKLRLKKLLPDALKQLSIAAVSAFPDVDAKYSVTLNGRPFSLHSEQTAEPTAFLQDDQRKRKPPEPIDFTLPMDPRETRYVPLNVTGLRQRPTGPVSVFPPDDVIAQVVLPGEVAFEITLRPIVGVVVSTLQKDCGCAHGEFHCNGTVLCCDPDAADKLVKCCDDDNGTCTDVRLTCSGGKNDTMDEQCQHGEFMCGGEAVCCDPSAADGETRECREGDVVTNMPVKCCGTRFVCNGTEMCCDASAPATDVLTCCDGSMGCRKQPRNCSCTERVACGSKQICCIPDVVELLHPCGSGAGKVASQISIHCQHVLHRGDVSTCNGTHFDNGTRCKDPHAPEPRPGPGAPIPGSPDPIIPDPPGPTPPVPPPPPSEPSDIPRPSSSTATHVPRKVVPQSPPIAVRTLPVCKAIGVLAQHTGPDPRTDVARLAVTQVGADTQVWELACGHGDGTCSAVFHNPAAMPYTQEWASFVTDADSRYQFPSVSSMGGDVGDLSVVLDIAINTVSGGERSLSMIADVFRLFFRRATRDPRIASRKIFYSVSRESMQAAQAEAGFEGDPTRPPTLEKANELAHILARPDHISSRFLHKLVVRHAKYGVTEGIVEAVVFNVVSAYLFGRVPGASADAQADSAHVAFWVQAGYVRPEAVLRVRQTLPGTGCENAFVATRQSLESPAGNPGTQVIALHAQAAHAERKMWAMVVNAAWGGRIPAHIHDQLADMASRLVARQEALALPDLFPGLPTVHVEVSDVIRD